MVQKGDNAFTLRKRLLKGIPASERSPETEALMGVLALELIWRAGIKDPKKSADFYRRTNQEIMNITNDISKLRKVEDYYGA